MDLHVAILCPVFSLPGVLGRFWALDISPTATSLSPISSYPQFLVADLLWL